MKKLILAIILTSGFIFFGGKITFAQNSYNPRTVKVITLSPSSDESKNFYPVWGEVVEVEGDVRGDVYAAGNEVIIKGNVDGDVLVAAGRVVVRGEITQNLRAVAGEVLITGKIGKNVTLLSGSLETSPDAQILGGVIALSQYSLLQSSVAGEVKIFGEKTNINTQVGSDLEVMGDYIKLDQNAKISGDVTYYSENNIITDPSSSISGKLTKTPFVYQGKLPELKDIKENYRNNIKPLLHFLSFVIAFIVGSFILRIFPKSVNNLTKVIQGNWVKSALLGFFCLIAVPVSIVFFFITLIGVPFAFFVLFVFLVFTYLSKIFVSYWFGSLLIKNTKKPYVSLLVGLLIYYVLTYVKFFGGLIAFLVLILGLGAGLITVWSQYKSLTEKKLL